MIKRPLCIILLMAIAGIIAESYGTLCLILLETILTASVLLIVALKKKTKLVPMVALLLIPPFFFMLSVMTEQKQINDRNEYVRIAESKSAMVILEGNIKYISDNGERTELILDRCLTKQPGDCEYVEAGGVRAYIYEDLYEKFKRLEPGNRVKIYGKLTMYEKPTNPGQFDAYNYNAVHHVYAMVNASEMWLCDERKSVSGSAIYSLRNRLREVYLQLYPKEQAGIISAMLLGDRSLMEDNMTELYKVAGISHILAISGLHISLICMGMYKLMERLRFPQKARIVLSFVILVFYVAFTSMGVSAVRAGIMTSALLLSQILRRHYDMLSALCMSALIILFINPLQLFDASFLLSVTAVVGVFAAGKIKAGTGSGLVIFLVTEPILLWFFYEASLYGPIANIFVLPISPMIVLFGGVSGLIGLIFLPLGGMFAGVTFVMLLCYEAVGKLISLLPYAYICTGRPKEWQMIVYYCVLLLAYVLCKKRGRICVKGIALAIFAISLICFLPKTDYSMAFLDVGQGDGIVNINGRECTVIDFGSSSNSNVGKYVLSPYLKYNGITIIERAIITHTDEDHINGIVDTLERMRTFKEGRIGKNYDGNLIIKNIVLPKVQNENKVYTDIKRLAEEKNVNVIYAERGHCFTTRDGECSYTCLAPFQAKKSDNGTSLIYRFENKTHIVYLTGDGDKNEEKSVMEGIKAFDTKGKTIILKAGHHGSRTSGSEEFIEAVSPDIVAVSCGKGNRYGHPHEEVLKIISSKGAEIKRTDTEGAFIFYYKNIIHHINNHLIEKK